MKIAKDADAILVTYAKITGDMIRQLTKCRIISRFGIGVDNVDIPEATKKGIVVTKVPDYCIDEVSDHAMALLLAVVRKIPIDQRAGARRHLEDAERRADPPAARQRRSASWASAAFRSSSCRRRKSFGMKVIAYDPFVPKDVFAKLRRRAAWTFPTLLKTSDYVSIHSPLVPETKGLFNADAFKQMKKTAYVVNTARGPIIDEAALAGGARRQARSPARRST